MLSFPGFIIWAAVFLIAYTYLIFPILVRLLSLTKRIEPVSSPGKNPSVAIICAMYNEEDVAEEKLANFKALSYPKLRMYIGSDGSTDRTNEILSRHAHDSSLSIFTFPRRGKVHVINDLIASASEEILVFTDANSMFQSDAVEKLVSGFSDPHIGAVCGRLKLVDKSGVSGEGFYWRFETKLKIAESAFKCVIGANGAIYAVRRELVTLLPPDTINDDFTISMGVVAQGYGMTYAEDAVATEEVGTSDKVEFKRHIRDAAGHYRAMRHLIRLLNPLFPKRFFFYVSHRVIRWYVPHMMLLLLLLPWLNIADPLALVAILGQSLFYGAAAIGWMTDTKRSLFYIPFYFTYINVALLTGFAKNLLGMQKVAWDRTLRV